MSASHSEDQSGSFIGDPAAGNLHLAIVPHPAHKVSQCSVLRDVIVAGRNWHVHHWASLLRTQSHVEKIIFVFILGGDLPDKLRNTDGCEQILLLLLLS